MTLLSFPRSGRFRRSGRWRLCGVALGIVLLFTAAGGSLAEDIVVVTNRNVEADTITRSYLRSVFGMRARYWLNGEPVKVFVLRDSDPVHARFSKSILKTFPFNLRKIWDTRVFSGTGQYPSLVDSLDEMRQKVASVENSIGYLPRNVANRDVKILELEEL